MAEDSDEVKRAKPKKLPNRKLLKERHPEERTVPIGEGRSMFVSGILSGWDIYSEDKEQHHPESGLPYQEPHDPSWAVIEYRGASAHRRTDPRSPETDNYTGITMNMILPNRQKRSEAHAAWAEVRHSRAPEDTIDILNTMGKGGVDPGESLAGVVVGLSHVAAGSIARKGVHFNGGPLHLPFTFYQWAVVMDGQEKSTRFQSKFADKPLVPLWRSISRPFWDQIGELEGAYQEIGRFSNSIVEKHTGPITEAYTGYFKPKEGSGGKKSPEERSLESRVLDTVRFALLMGQKTGFALDLSSNDWSSAISYSQASDNHYYRHVGRQLKGFLSPMPEVEELLNFKAPLAATIRHAEPEGITTANLEALKYFLKDGTDLLGTVPVSESFGGLQKDGIRMIPGEFPSSVRMVGQYITTLWPGIDPIDAMRWVNEADDKTKKEISKRIFRGHDHHKQMPQLARTSDLGFVVDVNLGETRDLNRNRAWGRGMAFPLLQSSPLKWETMKQVLAKGFGLPRYLTDISELKVEKEAFQSDLEQLYEKIFIFSEKFRDRFGDSVAPHALVSTIPLAHRVPVIMSGDPKQASYITNLRTPPGGHINYRIPMHDMAEMLANEDPLLEGLRLEAPRPDAANRDEFFSRK